MIIPIHKHNFRSKKIEYQIFPQFRKHLFSRKFFKNEIRIVTTVFVFWIFLFFIGGFGKTFLVLLNPRPYIGLKVTLPKAANDIPIISTYKDLNIFVDRNAQIIINDKIISKTNEIYSIIKDHRSIFPNSKAILYADVNCNMSFLENIFMDLRKAGIFKVYFKTR